MEVLISFYGSPENGEVFREEGQLVQDRQGHPRFWSPSQSLSFKAIRSKGPVGVKGVPGRGGVLRSAWLGDRVPGGPKFTNERLLRFGSLCPHFLFRAQELMGGGCPQSHGSGCPPKPWGMGRVLIGAR